MNAVEEDRHDLGGGEGLAVGEPRVRTREGERAQDPRRVVRVAAQLADVGREDRGDLRADAAVVVVGLAALRRREREVEDGDQLPDLFDPVLEDLDDGDELIAQRQRAIDRRELGLGRLGIERRLDRRGDERVLVDEDAEQGALGDAGREGDLRGRHRGAVPPQERHRRGDDAGAASVGR